MAQKNYNPYHPIPFIPGVYKKDDVMEGETNCRDCIFWICFSPSNIYGDLYHCENEVMNKESTFDYEEGDLTCDHFIDELDKTNSINYITKEEIGMLKEINAKIITAKKARDKFTSNSYVLLKAELLNNEKIEKPKTELDVVKSYVKKLGKSLEAFKGTDRHEDLVKEYNLVKTLLPEEMSEAAIREAVNKYVSANPEATHMGKVIGAMKSQLENANGAVLAKVVKEVLA